MRVKGIEHVAITVGDLAWWREFWERVLGIELTGVEDFPAERARVALYRIGDSMVELVTGTSPDSAYTAAAATRGDFLDHICLEVEDIDVALAELRARGVKLRDETPRTGHQGSRIAFLHPDSTGGVSIELMQR